MVNEEVGVIRNRKRNNWKAAQMVIAALMITPHMLSAYSNNAQNNAQFAPVLRGYEPELRSHLQALFLAPLSEMKEGQHWIKQGSGQALLLRIYRDSLAHYLALIPSGKNGYSLRNAGSYIVKRDQKQGAIQQIKIVLRESPSITIRISPPSRADYPALMELSLGKEILQRNIPLEGSIERQLLRAPTALLASTAAHVDWERLLASPDPTRYRSLRQIVSTIRAHLTSLPDAEDGAMDAQGRLVYIDSGTLRTSGGGFNCSGFTKWIADGLYHPLIGRYLSIEALKVRERKGRSSSWDLRYEEQRDPYFGLDWSRNIARNLWSARYQQVGQQSWNSEDYIDVTTFPYGSYIADVGYPVADLEAILYWLALEEPNSIYIGSVNRQFGSGQQLRQHLHLVALFPYFDEAGDFQVALMERNVEDGLASFINRNSSDFIHLVRLPSLEHFVAPQFKS